MIYNEIYMYTSSWKVNRPGALDRDAMAGRCGCNAHDNIIMIIITIIQQYLRIGACRAEHTANGDRRVLQLLAYYDMGIILIRRYLSGRYEPTTR